jgi:hypothetical protein
MAQFSDDEAPGILAAVVVPLQSVEAIRFGHPIPTASPAPMAKAVDGEELIDLGRTLPTSWQPRLEPENSWRGRHDGF